MDSWFSNVRVQHARQFAVMAHESQQYGDKPYVFHLDQVAALAAPFGEEATIIAYLHDTIEDTETSYEDILREFGEEIAHCTELLTDCEGKNRKERKLKTNKKLAAIDENGRGKWALLVKAADRLANVRRCITTQNRSLFKMYAREYEAFRKAVWRSGLADSLWDELDLHFPTSQTTS